MSSTSMKPAVPAKHGGDGTSIVALMVALMAAIFAFQLNASMLSPALTTMANQLRSDDAQIGLTQTVFFTGLTDKGVAVWGQRIPPSSTKAN